MCPSLSQTNPDPVPEGISMIFIENGVLPPAKVVTYATDGVVSWNKDITADSCVFNRRVSVVVSALTAVIVSIACVPSTPFGTKSPPAIATAAKPFLHSKLIETPRTTHTSRPPPLLTLKPFDPTNPAMTKLHSTKIKPPLPVPFSPENQTKKKTNRNGLQTEKNPKSSSLGSVLPPFTRSAPSFPPPLLNQLGLLLPHNIRISL
mmetsp:Transcript_5604/g.23771  ORF Transcript_5604/g.23771 Transcript_5604/m.23771 type:complete len:205 (+) Transcript_5604:1841-2455(+)